MEPILKLRTSLAANANANKHDVLAAKIFLQGQGFYHSPEWGLSTFPDRALFDAIKAFQKSNGLRVDGVMNPGGESEAATQRIQANALNLQSMGRYGDTILAHITPREAQLLKSKGGSGTINPKTGLLEFFKTDKTEDAKTGKYIWHTVGDGQVRSSHAERDGQEFAWDTPPEGGHPGEAFNCRCTAEDVSSSDEKCKELKQLMEEAWNRYDALQNPIEDAKKRVEVSEQILTDLKLEWSDVNFEISNATIPTGAKSGGVVDIALIMLEIRRLKRKLEEIELQIAIEERALAEKQKKLEQLEHDRENERKYAEELSRRYNACQEKKWET